MRSRERAWGFKLGDDGYVIHDVVIGRGNVDHVAVTPAGVFTIETKAILGKVEASTDGLRINGYDQKRHLKQAYAEAMAVRKYLASSIGRSY